MSYFVLGSTCSMHEHPSEGLGQEAGDISRSGPNDMASRLEDALLSTLHRCSEPLGTALEDPDCCVENQINER